MTTDGSYTCGLHSITYREGESLCCTFETNVTLSVNSNLKINFKKAHFHGPWSNKLIAIILLTILLDAFIILRRNNFET